MSTFILIHGSYHGSWCWQKLQTLLEQDGHEAIAIDLSLQQMENAEDILLSDYINKVIPVIFEQSEKVIVVGHSFGGHIISGVAEMIPERIVCLVYIAAVLLPSGRNASEIPRESHEIPLYPRQQLFGGLKQYVVETEEDERAIANYFYNACDWEEAKSAANRLCPQPVKPIMTPLRLTEERFGRVDKVYIECLKDNVIYPSVQQKMYTDASLNEIYSLDADHSPFLSKPRDLASLLITIKKLFNIGSN